MSAPRRMVVSMFSGGRGAAAITRELVRRPEVELNLLVNAYDDGLSTGEIRDHVPGMPGPSDFRKNLACLLDLYSAEQFALEAVLEYRIPADAGPEDVAALRVVASGGEAAGRLGTLARAFVALAPAIRSRLGGYVLAFLDYDGGRGASFRFGGCAVGNVILAGAFLTHDRDFNRATRALADLVGSKANLVNVTRGEVRVLAALKADGEVLERESRIVGPQGPARLDGLYLLERPLDPADLAHLRGLTQAGRRRFLAGCEAPVALSDEAGAALARSDVVVYGPGTQFSSLLPSYRTRGIAEAIAAGPALVRAFVVNLDTDHDIQGLTATDLVDEALRHLGDEGNAGRLITHVLVNRRPVDRRPGVALDRSRLEGDRYKGARVVEADLENPGRPGVHSGTRVWEVLRRLHDETIRPERPAIDVYVDLHERTLALTYLLQDFLEVPWLERFSSARLAVNRVDVPAVPTPAGISIERADRADLMSEVDAFLDWLAHGSSEYLVTITGDGEYRFAEVLDYIRLLETASFGLVLGSRAQSRRQFFFSLQAAYGESPVHYYASWFGALALSAAFSARYRMIFSDPLTGFRIYRRSVLLEVAPDLLARRRPRGTMEVARLLIERSVDVAEVPVTYRTFRGYTDMAWRFRRGLRNARSAFG